MTSRRRMLWGVAAALCARCTCVSLPNNVQWKCEPDQTCPGGGSCVGGYCVLGDSGTSADSGSGDGGGGGPDASLLDGGLPDSGSGDGGPVCTLPVVTTACNDGGWCWERPYPHGNRINGLFAFGSADIWAVGDFGTISHWDGGRWSPLASPDTDHNFYGVWGSSPGDVWIVGDGPSFQHWACTQWDPPIPTPLPGPFRGVWGSAASDVVAVGDGGISHFDGSSWTALSVPASTQPLTAVWGSGATLYAVGRQNTVLHRAGVASSWIPLGVLGGATVDLSAVWGDSANIWVAGSSGGSGAVARWSLPNQMWGGPVLGLGPTNFGALFGYPGQKTFAAGTNGVMYSADSGSDNWTPEATSGLPRIDFLSSASIPGGVLLVGGAGGTVATFNNTSWTVQSGGLTGVVDAVWASDAGIYAGIAQGPNVGAILHRDDPGGSWSVEISSDAGIGAVTTFAGSGLATANGAVDLWAADDRGQIWQIGPAGTWQSAVSIPGFAATAMIEGSDAGTPELWVVGLATGAGQKNVYSVSLPTLAYDGGLVGATPLEHLSAIEASPQRVVAVSQLNGSVYFLFQGNNVAQRTVSPSLYGIWSDKSSGIAYAVGGLGTICSGPEAPPTGWSCNPLSGYGGTFWSAWGPTQNDLWLAGDLGKVLHYTPTPHVVPVGTTNAVHAVGGPFNGADRWLVGEYGTILHHP